MNFFKKLFQKTDNQKTDKQITDGQKSVNNQPINKPFEQAGDEKTIEFKDFKFSDLKYLPNAEVVDEYAIWWQSNDEKSFAKSATRMHVASILKLIENHHSIFVGYLLTSIGLNPQNGRILLPKQEQTYLLLAPYNQKILLLLSEDKGILFLFNKATTKDYRDKLLKAISNFFYAIFLNIRNNNVPADVKSVSEIRNNFLSQVEQVQAEEEKGKYIDNFGLWKKQEVNISFVQTQVSEETIREMVQKPKDVRVTVEENGAVSGVCKSCQKEVHLNDKDGLVWFICTGCQRFTFYPLANIERDIHFAIKDKQPFIVELFYLKDLPNGMKPPFL